MGLQPSNDLAIPEQTAQLARAVFPDGHWCMLFRDQLGRVFRDEKFAGLDALLPYCWTMQARYAFGVMRSGALRTMRMSALPVLVAAAKADELVTYKDLAADRGCHCRHISKPLGCIRDEIDL